MAIYSPSRDALATLLWESYEDEHRAEGRFDSLAVRELDTGEPIYLTGTASLRGVERVGCATVAIFSSIPPKIPPLETEDILHKTCDVPVLRREPQNADELEQVERLQVLRGIAGVQVAAWVFERLELVDGSTEIVVPTGQVSAYIPSL